VIFPVRLRVGLALFVVLFGGVAACNRTPTTGAQPKASANHVPLLHPQHRAKVSDYLDLDTNHAMSGQEVLADVVISNPGKTFIVHVGCVPVYVVLNRGAFHQDPYNNQNLCSDTLSIGHGTTRLHVTIITMYSGCVGNGPTSPDLPRCPPSSGNLDLPSGTYEVVSMWSESVPLPIPKEVALTVTAVNT
jgi:hypothetical protein